MKKYSTEYYKYIELFCKEKDIADLNEFTLFFNNKMKSLCMNDELERVFEIYKEEIELNGSV